MNDRGAYSSNIIASKNISQQILSDTQIFMKGHRFEQRSQPTSQHLKRLYDLALLA